MRTLLKDKDYFLRYISELNLVINRSKDWLSEGKITQDRINIVKDDIRSLYLKMAIAKYSSGHSIDDVKATINEMLNHVDQSSIGLWKFNDRGETLDHYTLSSYDEVIWMVSLGYLLKVDDNAFNKLTDLIDADNVKHNLLDFVIRGVNPSRSRLTEESYRKQFGVPNVYETLRLAIQQTEKSKAQEFIKIYLQEWYVKHQGAGWYGAHRSKHDAFFGYWSFESAAVVKIMNLDDSSFRDIKYYPKDLVFG